MSRPRSAKVQEWTERFNRFQHTKATLAQFCRDEGVSIASFYQWRKRFATNPLARSAAARPPVGQLASNHLPVAKAEAR